MVQNSIKKRGLQLINSTMIYGIGTLLSKVLQFFFLPIITHKVSTIDYGFYDLIVTSASIIIPIMTLQIIEAIYKYIFNTNEEERKMYISSASFIIIINTIFIVICIVVISIFTNILKYPVYVAIYLIANELFLFLQKLARGLKMNKVFVVSGVINTFTILIFQLIFLFYFDSGVKGLLSSAIIGTLIPICYLMRVINISKYINFNLISMSRVKTMLKFSMPLVPNAISWWGMSTMNSLIIVTYIGASSNGIYAITRKIPTLLSMITGVFQLAWLDNVMLNETSVNDNVNSKLFNIYVTAILSFVVLALPAIYLIYPYMIGESYINSNQYVPFLMMASAFNSLSAFLGAGYISSGKTKGAFTTNIWGMALNLCITLIGIKWIGLYAPALGNLLANIIVFSLRIVQMKDIFYIRVEWKNFILLIVLVIVSALPYFISNKLLAFTTIFIVDVILFYNNWKIIINIFQKVKCKSLIYIKK